jgi:hypothetical protein
MRESQKQVIKQPIPSLKSIYGDFDKPEVDGLVRDRGYTVLFEKSYRCPCKSKEATHQNVCKNCGGTGLIFVNPTKTQMIITGIVADGKLNDSSWIDWGFMDTGAVMITALSENKLAWMDRITILTATAEHSQILYPTLTDDQTQLFAYTKYDIVSVDYIGLFVSVDEPLKKLELDVDYTFRDNVLLLDDQYKDLSDPSLTIRYIHRPVFHVIDVLRESLTSTKHSLGQGLQQLTLPIKALGKRAHLIKDVENFNGDRLLDNSWLPNECEQPDVSNFVRQLRYTSVETIYDNLTTAQKEQLDALIGVGDMIQTAKLHFTYTDLINIINDPSHASLLIPPAGVGKINLPISITIVYKVGTGGTPFTTVSPPDIQYGINPFGTAYVPIKSLNPAFVGSNSDFISNGASFSSIQGDNSNRHRNNVGIYLQFFNAASPITGGNADCTLDLEIQYITYDSNL